jgi:hypothetical protein
MSNGYTSEALREDVARVAGLFGVPSEKRDLFCDLVCKVVQDVRKRAGRFKPSEGALVDAANAARMLNEALARLNDQDRELTEELLSEHPEYSHLDNAEAVKLLREKVGWLVGLFSTAIGKRPVSGAQPDRRRRRRGDVENVIFQDFVFDLLSNVGACGGDFTFDKNYERGSLVEAIQILRHHLPEGVVQEPLSKRMSTIGRIVTQYRKLLPDIEPERDTETK